MPRRMEPKSADLSTMEFFIMALIAKARLSSLYEFQHKASSNPGEFAPRWSRINFRFLTMLVTVKAVNGRVGRVKTECSADELPLDPKFAAVLKKWKKQCPESLGDWLFPSPFTDRCYHASPIQQDYIRPAAEERGLEGVGWHTFRHTYRSWLDATGAPL